METLPYEYSRALLSDFLIDVDFRLLQFDVQYTFTNSINFLIDEVERHTFVR